MWREGRETQESGAHRGAALLTVCEKDKESFRLFFLRRHLTFLNAMETLRKIRIPWLAFLLFTIFISLLVTNNPLSSSLCGKSGL